MTTLTSLNPQPFVIPLKSTITIDVVIALPSDLKLYDSVKKKYALRVGMIYWLRSSLTGEFEQTPRIITNNSDLKQIKKWFDFDMIYIARSLFKE